MKGGDMGSGGGLMHARGCLLFQVFLFVGAKDRRIDDVGFSVHVSRLQK